MTPTSLRQALLDIVEITQKAVINFGRHECPQRGAALAYYALFSIFPLLLLAISAIGFMLDAGIPIAVDGQTIVLRTVEQALPQAKNFVQNVLVAVRESRGGTGLIGLLVLAWSASNIFTQARLALNAVWETTLPQGLTDVLRLRLNAFLLMLGTGLVLFLSFIFDTFLDIVERYATQLPWSEAFWPPVLSLILLSVTVVFFALLYRFMPRAELGWADVWPGAIVGGIGWEGLKRVFVWYTTSLANWEVVYGPIVSVIALLLWLYLSAQVLLFGAEFAAAYSRLMRERAAATELRAEQARKPVLALQKPATTLSPAEQAEAMERAERLKRVDVIGMFEVTSPTASTTPTQQTGEPPSADLAAADEPAAQQKQGQALARGTIFGLVGIFVAAGVIVLGVLATLWRWLTRRATLLL